MQAVSLVRFQDLPVDLVPGHRARPHPGLLDRAGKVASVRSAGDAAAQGEFTRALAARRSGRRSRHSDSRPHVEADPGTGRSRRSAVCPAARPPVPCSPPPPCPMPRRAWTRSVSTPPPSPPRRPRRPPAVCSPFPCRISVTPPRPLPRTRRAPLITQMDDLGQRTSRHPARLDQSISRFPPQSHKTARQRKRQGTRFHHKPRTTPTPSPPPAQRLKGVGGGQI